jgi:acetylornithine deacetylase/succinyl-diaminopimelate desuccinylase-like protein
MLNPWVSFGFQTARQAWEAQSAVMLRLVRMFGGGAFDQTEGHLTKETGTSVTEIQTAPTPVEEHSIVSPTTKEVTEGSPVHKKVDGATVLARLARFSFPVNLNPTTRVYFERAAELETPQTAADIRSVLSGGPDPAALARLSANAEYNAQLRTTCVATRLEGGHANNALPQTARAIINCRFMPNERAEVITAALTRVMADDKISVIPMGNPRVKTPSALNDELLRAIEKTSAEFWPGVPVVPVMSTGASDDSYLRDAGIPTYGNSGLASDVDDVRLHGKDERVAVKSFFNGSEYLYRLVKRLSGKN